MAAANEALEDMFATGEVCEGEHPEIRRVGCGRLGTLRFVIVLED